MPSKKNRRGHTVQKVKKERPQRAETEVNSLIRLRRPMNLSSRTPSGVSASMVTRAPPRSPKSKR
jgi:hypothetical protein